ncbi:MAG: phosphogluconate dehydratase [Oceanospirillaceae bacterium]|nr:phosphogluconate dehydratase [Oceanospirillaceae bacterium]MBT4997695.1 phosphogluconate dehydratase [Oceanospirillaceae bacterium]MBT5630246.1 phosphogluconate dehydratase [Oceanospirillaceae bacterium]MBT6101510.1 phosphogluconate dehydratase [Oceanospirillaceae bacterium]MBT7673088.1 phosphogluconate dehydratase [Oceanospirillaceae bacterium]
MHSKVAQVTQAIIERSRASRGDYLQRIEAAKGSVVSRSNLSCGNLAHGFAACSQTDKDRLTMMDEANVAIVSAYNDMLSAHQPFERYPQIIKQAVREMGSVAQFAGGVPAMCDGVTQGQPGMELSLFSRDIIAMSTAVALSHNMFDAVLCLGVCDKIIPGLLIGSLSFGHLPIVFVPAGPMSSGLPNTEKARIRQLYAEGKVGRDELLACESDSYHSAGTCTFYGTANSNQLLMEVMGLHMPGASFVPPDGDLRDQLTRSAAQRAVKLTHPSQQQNLAQIVSEKTMVNAIVALLATGGSTNHTIHLIAIAKAAGIIINWDDFATLSSVVPSLTRIYPNGQADINVFHGAGGVPYLIQTLLQGGLLHEDVETIMGHGLSQYCQEPKLISGKLVWQPAPAESANSDVLTSIAEPFSKTGGLVTLEGNLGRSVAKVSAVKTEHWTVEAEALVFDSQVGFEQAFQAGALERDFIAVLRFQGPQACGMPELHKLTPYLGLLQDRGFKVALVTDGRMSGASGKVPAAIHLHPEAQSGGLISKIENGDLLSLDCHNGRLELLVEDHILQARPAAQQTQTVTYGMGRELFANMRQQVTSAELGASTCS